ncbi:MAG TPA: metal ABC transporter permease [Halothiobacillus sp.]|nr:metal ABC transporter permease [Halothiobacillus sp.]
MSDTLWILAILLLTGTANALIGTLLVLRRMAMLSDAISHSVLFGLAVAYLIVGSRDPLAMFTGATVAGLFTAWLTDWLNRRGNVQHDASIGVVFTFLFALGVILVSAYAHRVHLDVEHVLYGEVAFAPFERLELGDVDLGPRAFWTLLVVALLNVGFMLIGFHRLQMLTFSTTLAATAGIAAGLWHYLIMTVTSLTAVASFEAVGAILVVALLVMPTNTAWLLAKSLRSMLWLAVSFAAVAVLIGYGIAAWLDAAIASAIAVTAGLLYFLVLGGRIMARWLIRQPYSHRHYRDIRDENAS